MTHDEMIEIVNAIRDGKTVQYRLKGCVDHWWTDSVHGALPNFGTFDYRAKPVPMEIWVNVYGPGSHMSYSSRDAATRLRSVNCLRTAKFVEVVE